MMSYYDFDYFWTHEEIGGKKLKVLDKSQNLDPLKKIRDYLLGHNSDFPNQVKNCEQNNLEVENCP